MYKTILVPLDGSKRAEAILPHVEKLAHSCDATVVFLHVVDAAPQVTGLGPDYAALSLHGFLERRKETEVYMNTMQSEFRAKGIDTKARIIGGPVVEATLSAAEREGADLIAMASHGRTGLRQVFYGSVAAGVLHRVDRPLLLIRSQDGDSE